ncbi:HEAT repeat domain-containing protein [Streptomyces sp. G45]|uniref:HEAT repeat domain-containing protein n=1 Tax=Streptomyces sp. G45 TaxID=3406627 RepID=UPI003C207357
MEGAPSIADLVRMRLEGDGAGLCRAARAEDHIVAGAAARLLGGFATDEAVDTLIGCVWDREEPRRGAWWEAVRSLGRLRDRRAVPALLSLLAEDGDGHHDEAPCRALAEIGGSEAVDGMLYLLERRLTDWFRSEPVLDALARLRPPEAVPPLLAALWQFLPGRAEPVVRALGAIRDPRAGAALLFLADSPESGTGLRRAAVEALHALPGTAWPPPLQDSYAERFLKRAQRDPDPDTARLATELLSRTGQGRYELWGLLRGAARSPATPTARPAPSSRSAPASRNAPTSSTCRTRTSTTPCSSTTCASRPYRPCAGRRPAPWARTRARRRPRCCWRRWGTRR